MLATEAAPAFAPLFAPLQFRTFTAPSRFGVSPHSTMYARDGRITEKHLAYYRLRAEHRAGMVFIGGLRIDPSALGAGCQISVADDEAVPGLSALAATIKDCGAAVLGQLLHPGLERSGGDVDLATVSPSSSLSPGTLHQPHVLTTREVDELVDRYAQAARRCQLAGFDGVEIHAAHGYLAHSFSSPVDNRRTDAYGEDRTLFLRRVIAACREITGDAISVGVRFSINDFDDFDDLSLSPEDMIGVAKRLVEAGCDFFDCSFESVLSPIPDMQMPPFAMEPLVRRLRAELPSGILVLGVGRILNPAQATRALQSGSCDGVLLARALIADPEWGTKAFEGRAGDIRPCIGCNQGCTGRIQDSREMRCLMNPETGHESDWRVLPTARGEEGRGLQVVVIGGGVAGLEAARVAAQRGAEVVICERSDHWGGLVSDAARQRGRGEFIGAIDWRVRRLEQLGVDMRLSTTGDEELLDALRPHAVILATGTEMVDREPVRLGGSRVLPLEAVRRADLDDAAFVCIVDRAGEVGAMSTAVDAAARGVRTVFITPQEVPSAKIPKASRYGRMRQAVASGVEFYTSSVLLGIDRGCLRLGSTFSSNEHLLTGFEGEGVVLETGLPLTEAPDRGEHWSSWAEANGCTLVVVGDVNARRDALHAIRDGYLAGRRVTGGGSRTRVLSF